MKDRWKRLAGRLGISSGQADEIFQSLEGHYGEPVRCYHNLDHIRDCLDELAGVSKNLEDDLRDDLQLAIWFHDVIYDPNRTDNEERSARFACDRLTEADIAKDRIDRVSELILATQHTSATGSAAEALMADIDLSILGRTEKAYDAYARAIRTEYAHVPEAAYRKGRVQVLRKFLLRDAIYSTEGFFARYEKDARQNLAREIESLS